MGREVGIVGGGMLGCLIALQLSRRGWAVTLFEKRERLLSGSSSNNEGKVHLGYTYGLDRSGQTRELMFRHGSTFEPLLVELLGAAASGAILSRRRHYAVHRDTSLGLDGVAGHMAAMAALLGDPDAVRQLPDAEVRRTYGEQITSVYDVAESSVECGELCALIADAVVGTPGIAVKAGLSVGAIGEDGSVRDEVGSELGRFDFVVNAAWDGMPAIEQGAGTLPHSLCIRGKAGFVTTLAKGAIEQAVTVVFGPFGNVLPLRHGRFYLSWYPDALMGLTTDMSAGTDWYERVERGFDFEASYRKSAAAMSELLPGVVFAEQPLGIRSGAILAAGETDIGDPASGLHRRTQHGIYRRGKVLAVDTGKLTAAPSIAAEIAELIAA